MAKCEDKIFKISGEQIIELIPHRLGCYATDEITVNGLPVGYMYREEPDDDFDSGWRFFSGTESQEYIDDSNNICIYAVNTIANYDKNIIPYLDFPYGTELERNSNNSFEIIKK